MTSKEIRIGLSSGLEARPAAMLVQVASQYESSIYVESEEKRVNAKSIMGMMTLGLAEGAHVKVTADGSDEESAIEGIEKYLSNQYKLRFLTVFRKETGDVTVTQNKSFDR